MKNNKKKVKQSQSALGKRDKTEYEYKRSFNDRGFYDALCDAQALIKDTGRERFSSNTALNIANIIKEFVIKYKKNRFDLKNIDDISISILDNVLFVNRLCKTYHDKVMVISQALIHIAKREAKYGQYSQVK